MVPRTAFFKCSQMLQQHGWRLPFADVAINRSRQEWPEAFLYELSELPETSPSLLPKLDAAADMATEEKAPGFNFVVPSSFRVLITPTAAVSTVIWPAPHDLLTATELIGPTTRDIGRARGTHHHRPAIYRWRINLVVLLRERCALFVSQKNAILCRQFYGTFQLRSAAGKGKVMPQKSLTETSSRNSTP
jgi:hypothetical protein